MGGYRREVSGRFAHQSLSSSSDSADHSQSAIRASRPRSLALWARIARLGCSLSTRLSRSGLERGFGDVDARRWLGRAPGSGNYLGSNLDFAAHHWNVAKFVPPLAGDRQDKRVAGPEIVGRLEQLAVRSPAPEDPALYRRRVDLRSADARPFGRRPPVPRLRASRRHRMIHPRSGTSQRLTREIGTLMHSAAVGGSSATTSHQWPRFICSSSIRSSRQQT